MFGAWQAEIGSGELRDVRREGDHATPTGVYPFGLTIYGNQPNPGGLHEAYHRLVCGDWWDEDPYSAPYNRFVHVACGSTPPFAARSEALWTETRAYPYFAVIDFNDNPTISGTDAPGSGIFLHAWTGEPTEGCVAVPIPELLRVLRWLEPADQPVIEIGTDAEVGRAATGSARPAGEPLRHGYLGGNRPDRRTLQLEVTMTATTGHKRQHPTVARLVSRDRSRLARRPSGASLDDEHSSVPRRARRSLRHGEGGASRVLGGTLASRPERARGCRW